MKFVQLQKFKGDGRALTRHCLMLAHKNKAANLLNEDILEYVCQNTEIDPEVMGRDPDALRLIKQWVAVACKEFHAGVIAKQRDVPSLAIPVNRYYFDSEEWPETPEEAAQLLAGRGMGPSSGVHFVYAKTDLVMIAYLDKTGVWANGCVTRYQTMAQVCADRGLLAKTQAIKKLLSHKPFELIADE